MTTPLTVARSFLFVPADRPERFARALASGAGGVIVDLEDAVAPERKASARDQLEAGVAALPVHDAQRMLVRINACGTAWHDEDCAFVARLVRDGRIAGAMLAKAERAVDVGALSDAMGSAGVVVPLIESVAGLDAINEIGTAPSVMRLAFGNLDFQADAGLACAADETELMPVRLAFALASRRAGLAGPIDGVTPDWRDTARLIGDAQRARRGGFGAKLCIHLGQIEPVNAALGPSLEDLAWAHRVIEAIDAAQGGVVSLDGRMVDAPVARLARRWLVMAEI